MSLGSTRSPTEMSKGGRCIRLTTFPISCADCLEILGSSTTYSPQGLSRIALPYKEINSFIRSKEIYDNLSYYQIRNKYCHNTTLPYGTFAHRFVIFLIFFSLKARREKSIPKGDSLRLPAG
jgi:hypothetical protein